MVQKFPPKPGLSPSPSSCHPTGSSWVLGLVIGYCQKPFLGSHVPIAVTIYSNPQMLFFQKNVISMCTVRLPQYYCIDLLEWERIWLEWTSESNAILQLCASGTRHICRKARKISEQEINRRPFPLLIFYTHSCIKSVQPSISTCFWFLDPAGETSVLVVLVPSLNTLVGIHMLCCTIWFLSMWTSSDPWRTAIHEDWWLFSFFWYMSHGAIQSLLDDFTNCPGPTFSKVGPNNSVQMASSSHVHIAVALPYTNQSSVNCTC